MWYRSISKEILMECKVCGAMTREFLDLGKQPVANRFYKACDVDNFYDLKVMFCPKCYTIQIDECPDVTSVFTQEYPFFTSSSKYMVQHFKNLADQIKKTYLPTPVNRLVDGVDQRANGFVVEIGSNDGSFLQNFGRNVLHLGVDPSGNIEGEATKKCVLSWEVFFNETVAEEIIDTFGRADVVVSANVFAHIPKRNNALRGIKKLLKPEGIWINEEAYFGSILEKTSYDQFYNEHIYYSSVVSFQNTLRMHDMGIVKVEFLNEHGGSVRYHVAHKSKAKSFINDIQPLMDRENLYSFPRLEYFATQVERSKYRLLARLYEIKSRGESISGYAATAKSTTILNYCKINTDVIDKIYDTTMLKWNTYSPGMNIPIVPYNQFRHVNPSNVVLFAWNHADEIYEKEGFVNRNWIIPIGG